jgi:hypothetical protein
VTTISQMKRPERVRNAQAPSEPGASAGARPPVRYEPPRVTYLGTLHELTRGGTTGPSDGLGGAGGIGSL